MTPAQELDPLEQALVRAGKLISYPSTPALAQRVRTQLAAEPRTRGLGLARPGFALRLAWAAVAAVLVALVVLLAFPGARDALAQFLGLRTVRILIVTPTPSPTAARTPTHSATPGPTSSPVSGTGATELPSATPTAPVTELPSATPTPTGTPVARIQCCETTLQDARARARFTLFLPPGPTPSRVYFQELPDFGNAQQVILMFGNPAAPRWTLYEAENIIYGKMLYVVGGGDNQGTVLQQTQVNGHDAIWLSGAPHLLVYLDAQGKPVAGTERPVNVNTLAWEMDSTTLRLETSQSEAEAIRFAESLR